MRFDPEISEWGNLVVLIRHRLFLNKDREKHAIPAEVNISVSGGKERESIPSVVASERGRAQTGSLLPGL